MKLYFVILCISVILSSTQAGLLREVVGSIHEKAHNIREDIRNAIHHKDDHHSNSPDKEVKPSTETIINSHTNDKKEDVTTEKAKENIDVASPNTDIVFPTDKAEVKPYEGQVSSTTVASKKDDKDGRENFAGGCATGFKKTADGRCKPTF